MMYLLFADERIQTEMNTAPSDRAALPPIDAEAPAMTEVATFALG